MTATRTSAASRRSAAAAKDLEKLLAAKVGEGQADASKTTETATRPLGQRITKAERTTLANLLQIDPASITKDNIAELREKAKQTDPTKPEKTSAKPKKPAMGPSGYRIKFGSSDAQIIAALREKFGADLATWTDEAIVDAIGWAYTVQSAAKKIGPLLLAKSAA